MKRLVLRKGFSFQRTPEGAAQLLDARTGDALLLQAADVEAIASLAKEGLDPQAPSAAGMLARFGSFLVTGEPPAENFYELDIADAPTMPSIPSVAPVTKTSPAIPRVPTFAELSVAAITADKPPVTTAPENWKVATARPPAVEPVPLPAAVHEQLNNDDWAVATSVPAVPAAPAKSKSGSHVAHAVSSMLPSLDDLVPPRGSDVPSISSDSPPPVATQPSPVPQIPPVRPSPSPAAPRPSPVPAIAPVLPVEAAPAFELEPLPAEATELEPLPEAATVTDAPLFELEPLPATDAEQELRAALAQAPAPETMPDDEPLLGQELPVEEPVLELAATPTPGPEQFRSQEENLRAALEQGEPTPQSRDEVQAMLTDTAKALQPSAPAPAPVHVEPAAPMPSSRKPMVLTFLGVMLLALGVAASFTLRPDGEKPTPQPPEPKPPPVVAVVDAGAPAPVAVVETPKPEPVVIDAGAPVEVAVIDAGVEVVEVADEGFTAEVIARGRVKMGEVVAGAEGTVSWTVEPGARVKSKQALGAIAKGDGSSVALSAPAVGLAMIKETGAAKKGAVLAEIIYFEAWAKAVVKDAKPTPAWQCEVISEAAKQRAPCKISVVTPKGSGAQVTVAIEPRWFDSATDAVLRLAAP